MSSIKIALTRQCPSSQKAPYLIHNFSQKKKKLGKSHLLGHLRQGKTHLQAGESIVNGKLRNGSFSISEAVHIPQMIRKGVCICGFEKVL